MRLSQSWARGAPSVPAAVALLAAGLVWTSARAGVITYTFGAPNNNAGTMAIGYPLEPVMVAGVAGYSAFYPVNPANMQIITFNVNTAAAGETLMSKQTSIVNYIKANLPNTLMVGTPANNQVSITIPAAAIAALPKGQVPGIGVKATNGVETEGFLRARIQANGDPTVAFIDFDGLFSSTDQTGLPSSFDAGIYSSFGSFDDHLAPSAFSSLDGFDIARKFYADLNSVASSLDVSLSFFSGGPEDGEIVVSFLNEPVGSNDGVSFGTTSAIGNVTAGVGLTVPEPPTWALMLLGFAGFGVAAHRRSRKASRLSAQPKDPASRGPHQEPRPSLERARR
jgi:hypothetical protein